MLLRTKPAPIRRKPPFRCENWWKLRDGFSEVCAESAKEGQGDWGSVTKSFRRRVSKWTAGLDTPDRMLAKIEKEMEVLQTQDPLLVSQSDERRIQAEHDRVLQMRDLYWHQRARINWGVLGDHNTHFFHTTAITRKRRNTVRVILLDDGNWVTTEKGIRDEFLKHYRTIYKKGARRRVEDVYPADLITGLPKVPDLVLNHLQADPLTWKLKRLSCHWGRAKLRDRMGSQQGWYRTTGMILVPLCLRK